MAALLGVDVDRTVAATFAIGAALAAVAGVLYFLYYGVVNATDGFVPGVKAFTAAVLGGIGSLPGAVLGGLIIGLIETFWSAYFSADYKDVAAFSILAITLIFMPSGSARPARRRESMTDAAVQRPAMSAAAALREAVFAALAMAVLSFPVVLLRAEIRRVQQPRPAVALDAVLRGDGRGLPRATAGRGLCACAWAAPNRSPPNSKVRRHGRVASCVFFPRSRSAAMVAYPLDHPFATLGPLGALKWVDNYGIQILIYVMLGWGLNIVVGLAGLLDLGYVAFYAVGAYTYALLSTTVYGLSFWLCLPLAGTFAALWGIVLGFPVLRLRGDYLAIVTLAFGEIIRIVLVNWSVADERRCGHRLDPAHHLLRPAVHRRRGRFRGGSSA